MEEEAGVLMDQPESAPENIEVTEAKKKLLEMVIWVKYPAQDAVIAEITTAVSNSTHKMFVNLHVQRLMYIKDMGHRIVHLGGPRGRGRGRGGRGYSIGKMRGRTLNGFGPIRRGMGRMRPYPDARGQRGVRGGPFFPPFPPVRGMMRMPFLPPPPRLVLRMSVQIYLKGRGVAFSMDLVHQPLRHLDGARDGLGRQVADTIKEAYSLN
ncbi:Ribonuclease Y [Varanus komodoensis]|nr:Ribonuclease Y [Varanus komodoensis]